MFKEQYSLGAQVETVFYLVPVIAEVLGIAALMLIDGGLSRARNALHTVVQKFVMVGCGMAGLATVGYGIWQWQYYKALGVPSPLKEALSDWWLFGHNLTALPQTLDPKLVPAADQLQLFWAFFVLFAGLAVAILHAGFAERLKMLPAAIIALVFGGLIVPVYAYLVYGSVGPLSNRGVHEFAGVFMYVVVGTWSIVFAWRARPRPGAFDADPAKRPASHNLLLTTVGVTLFLAALLAYVAGNGFLIPDAGYFGVHYNQSGFAFIVSGVVMAFATSLLGGIVLWRATGNLLPLLISPIAGFIAVSGMVDVAKPWEAGLVGFFAPFAVYLVSLGTAKLRIDDAKIGPLALGAGVYGAIATGIVGNGDAVGGYTGGVSGYEPGHATIGVGEQLLGVGVFVAGGALTALVLAFALERTIGLRASDDAMERGLDVATFGRGAFATDAPDPVSPRATVGPPPA